MALINCPECKKQVSEQARSCPHCGYGFQLGETAKLKAEQRNAKRIVYGIMIIGGILLFNWCSSLGDESSDQPKVEWHQKDNSVGAWTFAQFVVEKNLKSPSSAEFPWGYTDYVKRNGTTYYIRSYVDAQNGFGAMIRTAFYVECKQTGPGDGDWELIEFRFDE